MKMKFAAFVLAAAALFLAGCPSKNQVAALVNILGTSTAQIAVLEGNSTLAAKITTDTAAAVSAITNWQNGSPAQDAIQALNLVVTDLNLIPGTSKYAALVTLAVGTAESIIVLLEPQGQSTAHAQAQRRTVHLANPPKTASDFKKQWNALAAQQGLAKAKI